MTDNKDLNQRFDKLEARLESLASAPDPGFSPLDSRFPAASRSDEIDLRELFAILWQGKWWIIGITFLFAVAGVFYALSLPNMYKSEGVYAPVSKGSEGLGGGQLGGLASLAGVNLGDSGGNDIDQAVALIKSWTFLDILVRQYNLAPLVVAVEGWNRESGELIWVEELYDHEGSTWIEGAEVPSSYDIYLALRSSISVSVDKKSGLIKISVVHFSPRVSKEWVELLQEALNNHFRRRDVTDAKRSIEYLERQVSETSISGMHEVLYGMVESQIQTLMLAEVGEDYLLREVVKPKVPERKVKPARSVICVLFVLLGGFLASMFVLFLGYRGRP